MDFCLDSFCSGYVVCLISGLFISITNYFTEKAMFYCKQRKGKSKEKNKDENDKLDDWWMSYIFFKAYILLKQRPFLCNTQNNAIYVSNMRPFFTYV